MKDNFINITSEKSISKVNFEEEKVCGRNYKNKIRF